MVRCHIVAMRNLVPVFLLLLIFSIMAFWHMRNSCESARQPCVQGYGELSPGTGESPALYDNVPVYIVEEHHEVLKYWFEAAERGLIQKKGNVLLHIDGHSDGALPRISNILTLFKWPSFRQVEQMMQQNDAFVMAAALTELITRYIWVWPSWDPEMATGEEHIVNKVQLGTMRRLDLNNELTLDYCVCLPDGLMEVKEPICFIKNLTVPFEIEIDPIEVRVDECQIQSSGTVEIISETKAMDLSVRGSFISPDDSVILDIDEDFYGVESAVQPLYDAGLREHTLMWLDLHVSKLFCSNDANEEKMADRFFNSLLRKVRNLQLYCKQLNGQDASKLCGTKSVMIQTLSNFIPEMIHQLGQGELRPALCTRDESKLNTILTSLIRQLVKYTMPQLRALSQVGICHRVSVKTYDFQPAFGMKICDGYNKPNNTVIPFHMPTVDEIRFRTAILRDIVKNPYLNPKLVTVCRSTRDGYTPRSHFRLIESDVLATLHDLVKGVDKDMAYYDSDLLGGRFGWYNRH